MNKIGYSLICKHLISSGALINYEKHLKYLFKAAYEGRLEIIKLLHAKGFDLNARNNEGETPLFKAVKGQSIGVCKYLYKNGAKLNVQNIYGEDLMVKILAIKNPLIEDYFLKEINSARSCDTTILIEPETTKDTKPFNIKGKRNNKISKIATTSSKYKPKKYKK